MKKCTAGHIAEPGQASTATSRVPRPAFAAALWVALAFAPTGGCKKDAPVQADAPVVAVAEQPAVEAPPAAKAGEDVTLAAAQPGEAPGLEGEEPSAEPMDAPSELAQPAAPDAVAGEPLNVLILGDSLAATGFGALLEKRLDAHPGIVCHRRGKSASGLARPDFFDWIAEGKRQVEQRDPDLVVVIMGGNDGQDLTPEKPKAGKRVPWTDEAWASAYRERMDTFLATISGPERKVLWLELPTMGLRSLEKKLELIRDVQRQAVDALGEQGTYLETAALVTNGQGELLTHAPVGPKGRTQEIRAEDRIHFTMSGSEYFADKIYPSVLNVLGLPDSATVAVAN